MDICELADKNFTIIIFLRSSLREQLKDIRKMMHEKKMRISTKRDFKKQPKFVTKEYSNNWKIWLRGSVAGSIKQIKKKINKFQNKSLKFTSQRNKKSEKEKREPKGLMDQH